MAAPLVAAGVGALVSGIQAITGGGQVNRANKRLKKLFSQRKAYQTPQEIFQNLNFAEFNAAQGFSDETQQFLEGQAGAGLASALGVATRTGADPNQLSGILDSFFQNIFKIGSENEMVKMKKFDDFSAALRLVASSKEAEQISEDNLIKDQMQAEAQKIGAGQTNIQSGLNLGLQSITNLLGSDLYGSKPANRRSITASTTPATVPAARPVDLTIGNERGNFRVGNYT